MCNSGVGLIPVVAGKVRHFSAGGLYDGMSLIVDDETRSHWHHITGEAMFGSDAGKRLASFPIEVLTVAEARRSYPDLTVSLSDPGLGGRLMGSVVGDPYHKKGWLPPGFRDTMGKPDDRLPELTPGLGVVVGDQARFYPFKALGSPVVDDLGGKRLRVEFPAGRSTPRATIAGEEAPFQLLTRWYGFAYAFPGCEIYGRTGTGGPGEGQPN